MPMHYFSSRAMVRALLCALILTPLLACKDALAKGADPPVAVSSAAGQAVAPIPIRDIVMRVGEEQERLESTRQLVQRSGQIDAMGAALERIAAQVNAKLKASSTGALRGLPVMRLESLARHFDFDARRMQSWETQARRAFAPYDESAMQLAQNRAAWTATRGFEQAPPLPPVLAGQVDALLSQIGDTEALLADVLKREFVLMQRASDVKARIAAGRRQVAAAIDEVDERLLRFDAAPLWRAGWPEVSGNRVWDAFGHGFDIESQFAQDYNAAGTGNQQALRVVQALLLPLLLWLGAHSRRVARQAGGGVPAALRRPVSSWVLLSMLGVLVLEPDAPLLVHEVALLAAVLPVMRLLPERVMHASRRWAYPAIALYALDRTSVAAIADSDVYRWLLLVLTVLALWLAWSAMSYLRRAVQTSAMHRQIATLRALDLAALATLTVSLLCNVLGNVTLAETLTSGVIDSAYMAILMYAAAICCRDILRTLVSHGWVSRSRIVARHAEEVSAALSRLVMLAAFLGWVWYTLDRFRVLLPLQAAFGALMAAGIEIGEVSVDIGEVLTLAVAAWLSFRAAAMVRRVLREELPGHPGLARGVGSSIASLSYYTVLLLGLLFALSAAGVKLGQLAIVFGALGVGIGFGLQNVVNNFVSGLVLMFERPIQPGDTVDAAGVSGTVREIRLRSTTIRTADGADAVIPNGVLLNGSLTNWTMYDRDRRFELAVGVDYDADPAQVLGILNGVVQATAGVSASPAPAVMMTEYGENALKFVVSIWLDEPGHWGAVRGDLLAGILSALRAAGISIPYRQLDVNLTSAAQETVIKAV